jgi:glutaredoxin 3
MKKITIYSTATCGYCKMLKSYLHSKGFPYEEKHIDQDRVFAQELLDKSQQMGVPFTIIEEDGQEPIAILGFDKSRLDQVLGLA